MKYSERVTLKNGKEVQLRSGGAEDGADMLELFSRTHEETDYLLSYPDESSHTAEEEGRFLAGTEKSENAVEIMAFVDGKAAGTAGIQPVGTKYKLCHRAELGISVLKDYWGLGIGRALMLACLRCAREAGYTQVELEAAAENERAVALYEKLGFTVYGRNPRGFRSRVSGYQPLVYMRLEL